ncbi:MAG: leucyl aminopeptidase [Alphaproteobacteria bacterium]
MKIAFSPASLPSQNSVLLTVAAGQKLGDEGVKLDRKLGGLLKRVMASGNFTGAKEQTLMIPAPAKTKLARLILVGIGEPAKATELSMQRVGGAAMAALGHEKQAQATLLFDEHKGLSIAGAEAAANIGLGARLRSYRFDKYRTKLKPEQRSHLKTLMIATAHATKAKALYASKDKIADGVSLTRDLVSEPANIIYPQTLADACSTLKTLGVKVEVLDEKQMKKLGMGALLGVAQGSAMPPRLVTMIWNGAPQAKNKKPVVFVGKGVTFDTGGISIKPAGGMEDMKWDMGGAGAVIGAMKALAGRKAKANVIGIVGLVENMPSGNAQRPGDIVTTMSGQTVEVINTDAEGRLVLCDAMWYAQEKYNPRCIIDLATLTGAIIVSLGFEYAGLFSNNDNLSDQLLGAGKSVEEPLWRFPLGDAYDKEIDCVVADMKNIGSGRGAGSITAAQFLQRFIKKDMPWAHLDIAGMAWSQKDRPVCPKGASAFGVRLLDRYIADHIEGQ